MSKLTLQKRLAAEVLGVGINRVKIDPTKIKEVEGALTKEDIRILIEKGYIYAEELKGQSRKRARERHLKRKKGRRRGHGSRKGAKGARSDKKEQWMAKIRVLRRTLRELLSKGVIDRKTYREAYLKAKGGFFRSRKHLLNWLNAKRQTL